MKYVYRNRVFSSDIPGLEKVLASTGLFYDFEIDVALELMTLFLKEGERSGYCFYIAERENQTVAYINYGPTPCTVAGWDIFWIAVRKDLQNAGLGKALIEMAEKRIKASGGEKIWIETSSRADYFSTRMFYRKNGYAEITRLPDFYDTGDDKVIFVKNLKSKPVTN
jgi:Acetyltransferases